MENRIIWIHPTNTREGPKLTTLKGELDYPILSCVGCKHLGFNDGHYPYCSAQYADNQDPDKKHAYPWKGAGKHIFRAKPDVNACPYPYTKEE